MTPNINIYKDEDVFLVIYLNKDCDKRYCVNYYFENVFLIKFDYVSYFVETMYCGDEFVCKYMQNEKFVIISDMK